MHVRANCSVSNTDVLPRGKMRFPGHILVWCAQRWRCRSLVISCYAAYSYILCKNKTWRMKDVATQCHAKRLVGRKRDFCRSSARCWVTHWVTWGPVPPWTSVPLSVRKWRSSCQVRLKHKTILPFAVSACCRCQMLLEKRQSACNRSPESNVPWRVLDQLMISLCINWCHLGCRTKLGTVRKCLFSAQLLF